VLALLPVVGDTQVLHGLDPDAGAEGGEDVLGRLDRAAYRGVADHVEGAGAGHLLGQPRRDQVRLAVPALGQPAAGAGAVRQELHVVDRLAMPDQHQFRRLRHPLSLSSCLTGEIIEGVRQSRAIRSW